MRVCHVISPADFSGVTLLIKSLCESNDGDHKVIFFSDGDIVNNFPQDKVVACGFGSHNKLNIISICSFSKALFNLLLSNDYDVINVHSSFAIILTKICYILSKLMFFKKRPKLVITYHGLGNRGMSPLKSTFYTLFEKITNEIIKPVLIFVDKKEYLYSNISQSYTGKKTHILNGCPDYYNGTTNDSNLCRNESLSIIMVANNKPPKRQDELIRLFNASTIANNMSLRIIGKGCEDIDTLGNSRISVSGAKFPLDNEYMSSDILALLSDFEAMPVTVIEGMMHSLAILSDDVGQLSEVVDSDVGSLLNSRTQKEFDDKLMYICHNIEEIRKNSRKRYLEKFTINRMKMDYEDAYRL
tara:strand:- start:7346 stop:8416 length:1071 start_codon:yes stop_codon:yes gene_type:complete